MTPRHMCTCEGLPGLEGMVAWISAAKQLGTVSNAWHKHWCPSADSSQHMLCGRSHTTGMGSAEQGSYRCARARSTAMVRRVAPTVGCTLRRQVPAPASDKAWTVGGTKCEATSAHQESHCGLHTLQSSGRWVNMGLLRQKSSVLRKLRFRQSVHCRRVHSRWRPVSVELLGEEQAQHKSL